MMTDILLVSTALPPRANERANPRGTSRTRPPGEPLQKKKKKKKCETLLGFRTCVRLLCIYIPIPVKGGIHVELSWNRRGAARPGDHAGRAGNVCMYWPGRCPERHVRICVPLATPGVVSASRVIPTLYGGCAVQPEPILTGTWVWYCMYVHTYVCSDGCQMRSNCKGSAPEEDAGLRDSWESGKLLPIFVNVRVQVM